MPKILLELISVVIVDTLVPKIVRRMLRDFLLSFQKEAFSSNQSDVYQVSKYSKHFQGQVHPGKAIVEGHLQWDEDDVVDRQREDNCVLEEIEGNYRRVRCIHLILVAELREVLIKHGK